MDKVSYPTRREAVHIQGHWERNNRSVQWIGKCVASRTAKNKTRWFIINEKWQERFWECRVINKAKKFGYSCHGRMMFTYESFDSQAGSLKLDSKFTTEDKLEHANPWSPVHEATHFNTPKQLKEAQSGIMATQEKVKSSYEGSGSTSKIEAGILIRWLKKLGADLNQSDTMSKFLKEKRCWGLSTQKALFYNPWWMEACCNSSDKSSCSRPDSGMTLPIPGKTVQHPENASLPYPQREYATRR